MRIGEQKQKKIIKIDEPKDEKQTWKKDKVHGGSTKLNPGKHAKIFADPRTICK